MNPKGIRLGIFDPLPTNNLSMKYFILFMGLMASGLVSSQNLVAYRTAPLMDGDYVLDGTAYLEEFDDGTVQFRLGSDYNTPSGPDVHILLTNDNNYSNPIDTVGMLLIEDVGTTDGISHFSGAYTWQLPAGVSISDYDHVVFICINFGFLHWGNGTFGNVIPNCPATTNTISLNNCGPITSPSGNYTWTSTGVYNDTLVNAAGCDSILTVNATVGGTVTQSQSITICSNQSITIGSNTYNMAGTYVDTLSTVIGCDSIVTTNLSLSNVLNVSQTIDLCFGESVMVGSNVYDVDGMYLDSLTTMGGCDSIIMTEVIVHPLLDSTITLSGITLSATETGVNYQWYDCAHDMPISGETNQNFTATANGSYYVEVENNGCSYTSDCMQVTGVGIEEQEFAPQAKLYPNPTNGNFTLDFGENLSGSVTLYDISGRQLQSFNVNSNLIDVNIAGDSGLYLIRIQNAEGAQKTLKVRKL